MAAYGLVQVRWLRARPSGQPGEDVDVNTIHCGVPDGGWDTDSKNVFVDAWQTMFATLAPSIAASYSVDELRFYNVPASPGVLGEPVFIQDPDTDGSGDSESALPPQVALTVTWRAVSRRHWGRIYLPGFTSAAISFGRALETVISPIAGAFGTFGGTLRSNGQGIVVFDRNAWAAYDVDGCQIDDLWDVQRRRRFQYPTFRNVESFLT